MDRIFEKLPGALHPWYEQNKRDLPWRADREPYHIWVSEIMLQQTRVEAVKGYYARFLEALPTIETLSRCDDDALHKLWEGLGYYSRVRNLKKAAIAIMENHGGVFPRTFKEVLALPGIGDYTVGAVLSFAFNTPAPLVDANVSRVFARLCNDSTPVDSPAGRKAQWKMAADMVHRSNPRAYNSALMELGQTICTGSAPNCLLCPVRVWCRATQPETLPVKMPKKEITSVEHHDIFLLTKAGLLLEKQADGKRHEGMYRLPRRNPDELIGLPELCSQKYSVTRYKVTRHLYQATEGAAARDGEEFIPLERLESIPMASPDRKILRRFIP